MNTEQLIEAILFYKTEPVKVEDLAKILDKEITVIEQFLDNLSDNLQSRGVTLLRQDNLVSLGTNKEASELIESIRKEELTKELGKAGLETLTIIIYLNPVSRAEIDYIRGVNSSFIIRNLMIRGLIDRIKDNKKGYLYKPTIELLSYLGVDKIENLPNYQPTRDSLSNFLRENNDVKE